MRIRGEPQLQTKRRDATQVLPLQFLGVDMVVDVNCVLSGIPSQFLDQLSPHAASSEHSREPVPEAVGRESAFEVLALGIMNAKTSCMLGDYLVDGMGAESRAGFSDEQSSFLWALQIGISNRDPGPKDAETFLIKEDEPVRPLSLRFEVYASALPVYVVYVDGSQFSAPDTRLRKNGKDGLVPWAQDGAYQPSHFLGRYDLPSGGVLRGATIRKVTLSEGGYGIGGKISLEYEEVAEGGEGAEIVMCRRSRDPPVPLQVGQELAKDVEVLKIE